MWVLHPQATLTILLLSVCSLIENLTLILNELDQEEGQKDG
jgi:hypothetical protein